MDRKGKTRGKPQGRRNKSSAINKHNIQNNASDLEREHTPLVHSTNSNQISAISGQRPIFTKQNNVFEEIKDVFGRSSWLTLFLVLLCIIATVIVYYVSPPITIITIIVSLTFAGFLTIISTFFNQQRFHYRFLLMNESVSRFVSVLASSLLAKIIKFGEAPFVQTNLILPSAFFFLVAIIVYAISVIYTNELKKYLTDGKRHKCEQKTKQFIGNAVLQTEGINQKLCANTEDIDWIEFKKEIDSMTNRNIQFFLGFYFITISLLIYLQFCTILPSPVPNMP